MSLATILAGVVAELVKSTPTVEPQIGFTPHPPEDDADVASGAAMGQARRIACVALPSATVSPHTSVAAVGLVQSCELQVGYPATWERGRTALMSAISADAQLLLAALVDPGSWHAVTDELIVGGSAAYAEIKGEAGAVVGYLLIMPFTVEV